MDNQVNLFHVGSLVEEKMAQCINLSSEEQVLYRSLFVEKEALEAKLQPLGRKALDSKEKWSISSSEG